MCGSISSLCLCLPPGRNHSIVPLAVSLTLMAILAFAVLCFWIYKQNSGFFQRLTGSRGLYYPTLSFSTAHLEENVHISDLEKNSPWASYKKQRRLQRESCLHCPSTRHHYNVNCDPVLIIFQALVFNFNQSRWGLMYSFPYNCGPFWKGTLGYYLERQELLKRIPRWELSRQSGTHSDMEVHSIHSKRKGAGLWLYLWGRCF